MDIFVIHSGVDRDTILSELRSLKCEESPNMLNIILLDRKRINWKGAVRRSIKGAQVVLYVAGDKDSEKNIRWELNTAIKYRKRVLVIKLKEQAELNSGLQITNKYSGKKENYGYEIIKFDDILPIAQQYENETFGLINPTTGSDDGEQANVYFEQYKIFVKTSEDLVSRRQNVNSFYMSIHSALLALMGTLLALDIDLFFLLVFCVVLCSAGIIMAFSWLNMLESYGQLNSAKMKIIGMLELNLPLSMYNAEWKILDDPMRKERYQSFTEKERVIPRAFMVLYLILLVLIVCYLFSQCFSGENDVVDAVMRLLSHK